MKKNPVIFWKDIADFIHNAHLLIWEINSGFIEAMISSL